MENTDYKELYLTMARAAERAVRCLQTEQNVLKAEYLLITALENCEKMREEE